MLETRKKLFPKLKNISDQETRRYSRAGIAQYYGGF